MKTLIASLALLISSQALAVRVNQCPKSIVFQASKFNIMKPLADVKREVSDPATTAAELMPVAAAYAILKNQAPVMVAYKLTSARNGRCEYQDGKLEDRITMWTEGGQDRLFAQKTIAARGVMVRFYAKVLGYTKESIQISDSASVTLAVPRPPYTSYSAGGPLVSLGFANQVGAVVR